MPQDPETLRFSPASSCATMVLKTAAGSGAQVSGVTIGKWAQVPKDQTGEAHLSQQVHSSQPKGQVGKAQSPDVDCVRLGDQVPGDSLQEPLTPRPIRFSPQYDPCEVAPSLFVLSLHSSLADDAPSQVRSYPTSPSVTLGAQEGQAGKVHSVQHQQEGQAGKVHSVQHQPEGPGKVHSVQHQPEGPGKVHSVQHQPEGPDKVHSVQPQPEGPGKVLLEQHQPEGQAGEEQSGRHQPEGQAGQRAAIKIAPVKDKVSGAVSGAMPQVSGATPNAMPQPQVSGATPNAMPQPQVSGATLDAMPQGLGAALGKVLRVLDTASSVIPQVQSAKQLESLDPSPIRSRSLPRAEQGTIKRITQAYEQSHGTETPALACFKPIRLSSLSHGGPGEPSCQRNAARVDETGMDKAGSTCSVRFHGCP